jgi:hypothetical protein
MGKSCSGAETFAHLSNMPISSHINKFLICCFIACYGFIILRYTKWEVVQIYKMRTSLS